MSTTQPTSRATNNGAALPTFSDTPTLSSSISSLSSNAQENANQIEQLKKIFEGMRNTALSGTVSNKDKNESHVVDLNRVKEILSELKGVEGQENLITEAKELINRIEADLNQNISRAEKSLTFAEQNFPA